MNFTKELVIKANYEEEFQSCLEVLQIKALFRTLKHLNSNSFNETLNDHQKILQIN